MKCSSDASTFRVERPLRGLSCLPLGNRTEKFLIFSWMDQNQISEIAFNPSLSDEQFLRARRVFKLGIYSATGLLLQRFLDLSQKVKHQFLIGDYQPPKDIQAALLDTDVLKVGIHLRHLPFVVRDEGGSQYIDKRALKCLEKSLSLFPIPKRGCLILVASDMIDERPKIQAKIAALKPSCQTFFISRTNFTMSSEWGQASTSAWEKRNGDDRRGMLEAYLDNFLLSEFSQYTIIGLGSTFSQLIAYRNSAKVDRSNVFEFASSSCKEDYLPYQCCIQRKRWNDVYLRQSGELSNDCSGKYRR